VFEKVKNEYEGLYEFKIPNTFGATAFCGYGAFWVSFATYIQFVVPGLDPSVAHEATGLFLLVWTIFTLYLMVASFRVSVVLSVLFVLLEITFILLTIGNLTQANTVVRIGGWFGLATALSAWYGSAAVVINSTWARTMLPVGAFSGGQRSASQLSQPLDQYPYKLPVPVQNVGSARV